MCDAIDHGDLVQVRQVHKNCGSRFFELERFGMGTQFKVLRETLIRFGANDRDARSLSVTVSYVNTFADGIVPKVSTSPSKARDVIRSYEVPS